MIVNPYLPFDEFVPDVEPRVFGNRLYLYGSHDRYNGTWFCEKNDYVCYSCPIDDPSVFAFHGVIYRGCQDPRPGNLYAPDCVQGCDGRYYLYYSKADSSVISVAVSSSPTGPFSYYGDVCYPDGRILGEGEGEFFQFDPAVHVEGGCVYLYSGSGQFNKQGRVRQKMVGLTVTFLSSDMKTVVKEPVILLPIGENKEKPYYMEAPSIRKIGGRYYLVYYAVDGSGLHYCTSTYPDRDFAYRGCIHSSSDVGINGHCLSRPSYPLGNCHGGIAKLKDGYYIFDHRQIHRSSYSRQGIAEKITMEEDGTIRQVATTSYGLGKPFSDEGCYPAYIACNLISLDEKEAPPDIELTEGEEFIANIRNGALIGFKSFVFAHDGRLALRCRNHKPMKVSAYLDENRKHLLFSGEMAECSSWQDFVFPYRLKEKGLGDLFFFFEGEGDSELLSFCFLAPSR